MCLLFFNRCELRIVSDANMFFIETILKHHGLIEYFTEINTNPGFVDDEGRLRIFPYHDFTTSSHGCGLCPPNMCKVYNSLSLSLIFSFYRRFCGPQFSKQGLALNNMVKIDSMSTQYVALMVNIGGGLTDLSVM